MRGKLPPNLFSRDNLRAPLSREYRDDFRRRSKAGILIAARGAALAPKGSAKLAVCAVFVILISWAESFNNTLVRVTAKRGDAI